MHKKISSFGINESRSKGKWSISYVTCLDIIAKVSLPQGSIFLFLDVWTLKLKIAIILPTHRPT